MSKKEKKNITSNECGIARWILAIVIGIIVGAILSTPVVYIIGLFPAFSQGGKYEYIGAFMTTEPVFMGLYIGMVLSLRLIAKTPVRTFISGVDGKVDWREVRNIALLYMLGLVLQMLPTIGNVKPNSQMTGTGFVIVLVTSILFIWMQTSWEEFIFRGVFIRATDKNNVHFSQKSVIVGIIASLLFMASHLPNVEVVSQKVGVVQVLQALSYFISGIMMYLLDLYFGSLVPGLVIHWVNNFFVCLILSSEVSSDAGSSLLVDYTPNNGAISFLQEIIVFIPILIWIIVRRKSRKRRHIA